MRPRNLQAASNDSGPVSPLDVIDEIDRILAIETDWQPGCLAVREDGTKTVTTDLACVRRSLPGALQCALSFYGNRWNSPFPARIEEILTKSAGRRYDLFDADPATTFADVKRVIASAREAATNAL